MTKSALRFSLFAALALSASFGCNRSANTNVNPVVFFNITQDGKDDAQKLDMAMKLAGFSLDEDRKVVLFFNVKGVHVPTKSFPDDFKYKDETIKAQLEKLIERGAEVHVCPVCMKALGVEAADLIEGAEVTTRPGLFAHIGPGTTVFTY